jgi:hypothetical protein
MGRIRIDKIKKKPSKNKIIDLEISKLNQKKDNNNYPYNSNKWIFKLNKTQNLYLNRLVNEESFNSKIEIIKDFKYFLLNNNNILSEKTLRSYYDNLKFFLKYEKLSNFNINKTFDINYNLLLNYSNYLQKNNEVMSRYDGIRALLKRYAKTEDIHTNKDIKNNVYPTVKLNVTNNTIKPYKEEEFQYLANFITQSLNNYFENKKLFGYKNFCKCAYWYFSILTGLNKTALNSLKYNSIEKIKENDNTDVYWVVGEKNRNNKGFQNALFAIRKENSLFKKVYNEIIKNNKKLKQEIDNPSLFTYEGLTGISKYNGVGDDINKLVIFKNYIKNNPLEEPIPTLSTSKIRNFLSASVYHKTKDEQIVSTMLDHENQSMTNTHYMKHKVNDKIILKFNTVQEIMVSFSKNENFDDWVTFQNSLNLKDTDLKTIIGRLKEGFYSSQVGQCIRHKKEIDNLCTSYINCFKCKHFSVIGERDAWKLMSFKEALFDLKGNSKEYKWIYPIINNILSSFDKNILLESRKKLNNNGRHPFWKNKIIIKNITEQYEKNK